MSDQHNTHNKDHLILKFGQGEKGKGYYGQNCNTLVLRSEDNQDVVTFPMDHFSFYNEPEEGKALFKASNDCLDDFAYSNEPIHLEMSKNNMGELKLTINRSFTPTLSLDSIKNANSIDFEQYISEKKLQVKPGEFLTDKMQVASLYDSTDKKIGDFSYSGAALSDNQARFRSDLGHSCDIDFNQLPNMTVSKVDGKYQLQAVDNSKMLFSKVDCFNSVMNLDHLNPNYDLLDKLYGEEIPETISVEGLKNQIKVLSQEKDQCEKEKGNLTKSNTELTTKVNDLTQEKSSLLSKKEELSDQISKLAKQNESLCNELNEANTMADLGNHQCMEEKANLYLAEDYANAHQLIA